MSARWLGSPSTTNSIHESADPPPVLPLPLYSCVTQCTAMRIAHCHGVTAH